MKSNQIKRIILLVTISITILFSNQNIITLSSGGIQATPIVLRETLSYDFISSDTYIEYEATLEEGYYSFKTVLIADESLDIKLEILFVNGTLWKDRDYNGAGEEERLSFTTSESITRLFRLVRVAGSGGVVFTLTDLYIMWEPVGHQDSLTADQNGVEFSLGVTGGYFNDFVLFDGELGTKFYMILYTSPGVWVEQIGSKENFACHIGYIADGSYAPYIYRFGETHPPGNFTIAMSPLLDVNISFFFEPWRFTTLGGQDSFGFVHSLKKDQKYYYEFEGELDDFLYKIFKLSAVEHRTFDVYTLDEILAVTTSNRITRGIFTPDDTSFYGVLASNIEKNLDDITYKFTQINPILENELCHQTVDTENPLVPDTSAEYKNWEYMFEIEIFETKEYRIKTDSVDIGLEIDLKLLNSSFAEIYDSSLIGPNESITEWLDPGIYYAYVQQSAGTGSYDILWENTERSTVSLATISPTPAYDDTEITMDLMLEDENGIDWYSLELDGVEILSTSNNGDVLVDEAISLGYLPAGTHNYRISVKDLLGNEYVFPSNTTTYSFSVNEVNTDFTVDGFEEHASYSDLVVFTINPAMSDRIQRCEYYLDEQLVFNTSFSPFTFSWDPRGGLDGVHNIKIALFDDLNRNTTHSYSLTADTNPPEITFLEPIDQASLFSNQEHRISAQITDISPIQEVNLFIIGNDSLHSQQFLFSPTSGTDIYSFNWDTEDLHLIGNRWILRIVATDSANNTGVKEIEVNLLYDKRTLPPSTVSLDIIVFMAGTLVISYYRRKRTHPARIVFD